MQLRSDRVKADRFGPVKRKADEPAKLPDKVDSSQPRRRGLFQDETPSDAVITTPPHRLAAQSPIPVRDIPQSPFQLARVLDTPRGLNLDENTPPRKRRLLDDDAGTSVIMEDAPGAIPDALTTAAEPAATPQQAPRREQEEAATPSTWFTPVRPSRPPRPPTGHAPSGPPPLEAPHSAPPSMPARMPSFAQWMEDCVVEDSPDPAPAPPAAEPMPFASPQPTRRGPPGARGGVDMTDLALLYDPVMAAAAGRSPPTPIEKILQRQPAAAAADAEEDEGFEQDEFEPAYDN